jgi:hypothetical protein
VETLQPFIDRVNRSLESINPAIKQGLEAKALLDDYRIQVSLIALIFLTLGLAGSIGESAFQLNQARRSRNTV